MNGVEFIELFAAKTHEFISSRRPLANRNEILMKELEEYPYLSFEQGEHNSFYYSEEIFSIQFFFDIFIKVENQVFY
ncbi:methionine biosynthesis and transport regulator MtaR, LysR family [Lachnospiraceae bacterium KM106-2]|nr:methionine biosynthesis and transport regulator MtaR, LysR family [Lachnospiraceae bacterium KM106-2]